MRPLRLLDREIPRIYQAEIRATGNIDEKPVIEMYAAVFGVEATMLAGTPYEYREKIRQGAFTKTLLEFDQRSLWNHQMFMPLGRKSVGTLELREDEHGLHTVIHLDPRQSYHRDAWFSVDRGDTQGASFKFDAIRAPFDRSTKMRELIEVRLYEVSPVTFPAYEPTEAIARDLFSAIDSEITTQEPDMHHSEATEPDMHHSDAGVQQTKRNVRNASLLLAEMEARQ